ncbi:DUF1772 domain-containing protein [bacterium]|nr:MAG: DUF1772 domain-containing protein [bacterium]
MTPLWMRIAIVAATIGSGLVAGTFFAFSAFVMPALGRLPKPQGIAAMQAINVAAVTPLFMAVFVGTALLSLGLAIATFRSPVPGMNLVFWAALLYLVGSFVLTIAANVPLNDALAGVTPETGGTVWSDYLRAWTLYNHVRTVASAAAMLTLILGLLRLPAER